jgi:hypothetical protein
MGRRAKGSLLQMGDGAVDPGPEAFTAIAKLTSFKPPAFGEGVIDTTNFDSAADEHVTDGIQSHGEVPVEGFWLPEAATHGDTAGLAAKAIAGGTHNFKVVVNTATGTKTFAFAASVRFEPNVGGPRDALKFSGALRISAGVTITTT